MKFIYLDAEGNQVGPVDESVIIQAIRSGKLTADSAIRNSLLREFRTVAEFDCFAEVLKQTGVQPDPEEAEAEKKRTAWAYLRHVSQLRVQEEQNRVISSKLFAKDASALRRVLAMLLDVLVLLPVIAVIFTPSIMNLKYQGKRDSREIIRQQKAREIHLFTSHAALQQNEHGLTDEVQAAFENINQQNASRHRQLTNRALLNKTLPGTMNKLDNAYKKHNENIEKAGGDETKAATATAKRRSHKKQTIRTAQPPAASGSDNSRAAYKNIRRKDRPQVLVRNMPGGKIIARYCPAVMAQWEDFFYADGNPGAANGMESLQNKLSLNNMLISGRAKDTQDGILLRVGGDIRKITHAELAAHFTAPLKWVALAILLYYTLALSIFAQTVGMWFWGIFLTREPFAEVLPFRALLYTLLMLLTGVLMIPMVIISKRSLADWICKVRQVGVASVSKSS